MARPLHNKRLEWTRERAYLLSNLGEQVKHIAAEPQPNWSQVATKSVPQRGSVWVGRCHCTLHPILFQADPHATALWY